MPFSLSSAVVVCRSPGCEIFKDPACCLVNSWLFSLKLRLRAVQRLTVYNHSFQESKKSKEFKPPSASLKSWSLLQSINQSIHQSINYTLAAIIIVIVIMCCCCPSAISALFCLWVQSGCSKGTVAGALTFFPPEPALYQFERHDRKGRVLGDTEDAGSDDDDEANGGEDKKDDRNGTSSPSHEDDCSIGEMGGPPRTDPLEAETKGQTQEQMKSPIQQLTEQAAERRKRSKQRNLRDARDARHGVTYKLLLDPRLQVPPHDDGAITAVKVPSQRGVYVATVVYRVPAERRSERTKTLIYSHGNATDLGAMFPIQVVLAHSLDCNVVVYDYSGYGESGGVPDEFATYRDIDAVFEYVVDSVAGGNPENVVLYGQSVGSGPCCYLAAKNPRIGGMILHSPFTSGMRVLTPSRYVCTTLVLKL